MFGIEINEETFAEMQSMWLKITSPAPIEEFFDITLQKVLPGFDRKAHNTCDYNALELFGIFDRTGKTLKDINLVISAFIFGCFGCKIDYDFAEIMSIALLKVSESYRPQGDFDGTEEGYIIWQYEMAVPYILLGNVYSYKKEYIKAAYYYTLGLKTECIQLNAPQCDYINYIMQKLDKLPKEEAGYSGCGFEPNNPMGSVCGYNLIPREAREIIPEMEGVNGEVVIAKCGRARFYGHLDRLGHIMNKYGQLIDIYETYIIDRDFHLFKQNFYFNGYCIRKLFSRSKAIYR